MKTSKPWTVALLAGAAAWHARAAEPTALFMAARPVWPDGMERERNLTIGFRTVFPRPEGGPVTLRATGSTLYRVFVNGRFLGHGPARAAHGFYRVDEWDITDRLRPGANVVAIEVAGYNVNSYAYLDQPSFLQAEVAANGRLVAATGADAPAAWAARPIAERVRKVPRYSFQRPFMEVWRLEEGWDRWRGDPAAAWPPARLALQPGGGLLPRGVDMPTYAIAVPVRAVADGTVETGRPPVKLWKDRSLTEIGPELGGFSEAELETVPPVEWQSVAVASRRDAAGAATPARLPDHGFRSFDFGTNLTGFVRVSFRAPTGGRLVLTWDEMFAPDGRVDWMRLRCASLIDLRFGPGTFEFESMEPYTLRALQATALGGEVEISEISLREFAAPGTEQARIAASDAAVARVFEAARQTFRQNSLDIFMDCPSRERAGWLCDSFFTARSAVDVQGHARIERAFLENFALPKAFPHLPDGMLPMCYPSDHPNGNYIPNWAMWFVLELREYLDRTGDRDLVERLRPRVQALLRFFERLRNADGLLEKLPKWVFVEWSKANSFVQDVNYPSNMLYAEMLDAAADLYGWTEAAADAARVRDAIRRQSFDGEFFVDNAVRKPDGALEVTRNRTETCQYYAFFFGVATPATHRALWDRLVSEFGPARKGTGRWPDIHPSNQLIGNVMRFELLSKEGLTRRVYEESIPYHLAMADLTGTLWEHDGTQASCNHGFASHGGVRLLFRDVLGLKRVHAPSRSVEIRLPDVPPAWCEGAMPTPDGLVALSWRRADGRLRYRVRAPDGYRVRVDNASGLPAEPLP